MMDSLDLYDEMLCESTDNKLKTCKPEPEEESLDMYSDFDAGASAQDQERHNTLETDSKPLTTSSSIDHEEESMDLYSDFVIKSNTSSSLKPSKPPPTEESLDLYSDIVKSDADGSSVKALPSVKPSTPAEESLDLYSEFVGVKSEHLQAKTLVCNVKVEDSSARPVKDDGDVDLDLFTEVLTDELQHKHDSQIQLAKKLTTAQMKIQELERELKEARENQLKGEAEVIIIKKNLSSLLLTARNELRRKDNEIRRLNLILAKKKVNSFGMKKDNGGRLKELSPSHRNQTKDRRYPNSPTSSRQDSDSENVKRKRLEPVDQGTPKRQRIDLDRQSRTPDTKDRKLCSDSTYENRYSGNFRNEGDRSANNSGRNDHKQRYTSEKKGSGSKSDRKASESKSSFERGHKSRSGAEKGVRIRSSPDRTLESRSSPERSNRNRSSAETNLESRSSAERGFRSRSSAERSIRSKSSPERGHGNRSSAERKIGRRSILDRVDEKRAKFSREEKDSKSKSLDSDKNQSNQRESEREIKESRERDMVRKKRGDSNQKSKGKMSGLDLREKLRKKRSGGNDDSGGSDEQLVDRKVFADFDAKKLKETTGRKLERKSENKDLRIAEVIKDSKKSTKVKIKNSVSEQRDNYHEINLDFKKEEELRTKVNSDIQKIQSEGKSQECSKNDDTTIESPERMAVVNKSQASTDVFPDNMKTTGGSLVDQCNNLTPADLKAKRRIKPIMLSAKKTDSSDSIQGQACLDSVIENIERRESLEFAQAKVVHVDTSLESCSSAFSLASKSPDTHSSKSSVLESVSFTCRANLVADKCQKHTQFSDSFPSQSVSRHLCSESSEMILKTHSDCGTHTSDSFSKYSDISSIVPSESASCHGQRREQFMSGTQYSVENEHFLLCTANPFPTTSSTCFSHVSSEGKPDSVVSDISDRECSLGFIIEDESCSRTVPFSYNKSKGVNSETEDDKTKNKSKKKKPTKEMEKDYSEINRDDIGGCPSTLDDNEYKSAQKEKPDTNLGSRCVVKTDVKNSDIRHGIVQKSLKESYSPRSKECQKDTKLPCDKEPSCNSAKVKNSRPVCGASVPCIDCRLNGHERPPYHVEPIEFTSFPKYYAKSESEDDDRPMISIPSTADTDGRSSDMDTGIDTVMTRNQKQGDVEAALEPKIAIQLQDNTQNSSGFNVSVNQIATNIHLNSLDPSLQKSHLSKELDQRGFKTYGRQMSLPETNSKNFIRARSSSKSNEGSHLISPARPKSVPLLVYQAIDLSVKTDAGDSAEKPTISDFSVSEDGALDLSRKHVLSESCQPVKLKKEPIVRSMREELISDDTKSSTRMFKLYRPPIVPQRSPAEIMEVEEDIRIVDDEPNSQLVSERRDSFLSKKQEMTRDRDENNFRIDKVKDASKRINLITLKKEPSEIDSEPTVMDVDGGYSTNKQEPFQKISSSSLSSAKTTSSGQMSISTSPGKESDHSASEYDTENNPSGSPNNLSHSPISTGLSNTSGSQESKPSSSQSSYKSERASSSQSPLKCVKSSSSQSSSKSDKQSTSSQESSKSNKTSSTQEWSKTDQDSTTSQVSPVKGFSKPVDHSSSPHHNEVDVDNSSSDVCVTDDEDLDCESSQSQLLVKSLSTRNIPSSSRSFDLVLDLQISDDSSISCKDSPESIMATKTTSCISIEEPDFKFPDMSKSSFGKSPKSPKLSKTISPDIPRKLSFPQEENSVLSILADSCDGFDCEPDDHQEDCRKYIPESAAEPDPEVKDEDEDFTCAKGCDDSEDQSEDSETCAEDGEITDEEAPTLSTKGPVVHDEETQELMELLKAKKLLEEKILGICSRSETNSSDDQGRRSDSSRSQKDRKSNQSSRHVRKDDKYTREIHRSDPRLTSRHNVRDEAESRHRTYSPSGRHRDRRHRARQSSPVGRRDSSRDHDQRRDHDKRDRYMRDNESDRKGRSGHSSHRRTRDVR